jgi:hypothetical protein
MSLKQNLLDENNTTWVTPISWENVFCGYNLKQFSVMKSDSLLEQKHVTGHYFGPQPSSPQHNSACKVHFNTALSIQSSHSTPHSKGKVVPVLFFNQAPRHEGVLGKWRHGSTNSLTSALDRGEWSASHLSHFTPRERTPGTHWIGGWVGPRIVLDVHSFVIKFVCISCFTHAW